MGSSVQLVGSILVEGGTQLLASSCQLTYLGLGFGLDLFVIDLRHMCGGLVEGVVRWFRVGEGSENIREGSDGGSGEEHSL